MTINYRVMPALAGLFMALLAIATTIEGFFGGSWIALLLYWAIA